MRTSKHVMVALCLLFLTIVVVLVYPRKTGDVRTQHQRNLFWFPFRSPSPRNEERLCNGHANLCSKPANEVIYATMHNANNAAMDGGVILPNHKLDLKTALNKGYRGLNMDFGRCLDKITLLHATCLFVTKVSIDVVLQEILDFLDANPNEVLILPTEIVEDSFLVGPPPTIAEIDTIFQSVDGWKDKLYDHPGPGTAWPTLQELIDADKRIIYFFYRGESCTKGVDCPVGFNPWFQYAAETQFSFPFIWSFDDKARACEITRGGSGTRDFFGVNIFVTPSRFISPVLRVHKADFLRNHLQACKDLNGGLQPNVVLVDFWDVGDVMTVVDELNAAL